MVIERWVFEGNYYHSSVYSWFQVLDWRNFIQQLVHQYSRTYNTGLECMYVQNILTPHAIVILFTSFVSVFLISVLRVILSIMNPNSSNPVPLRMRRAVRAALILIPLFGLQYVLLPKVPDPKHPLYHSYLWLSLAIVPLQVIMNLLSMFVSQNCIFNESMQ